uniref:NADH-ubiquinone oxidoreductase chain 6 n=1 Tax=Leptoxis ampla TaxID=53516 RepID=A0A0M4JKE8_9CAEN|nr:NADH dehydrogenase subunit 6 [Leptoxis ampla]
MSTSIILSLGMCSVFLFPLMMQPLSLGLSVMISTMFLCILTAIFLSSWYAYILFLIYVGGLLVMFTYVAALSPNSFFKGKNTFLFILSMQFIIPIILYNSIFMDTYDLFFLASYKELMMNMKTVGIELVSPSFISILIGLGIILFINLVVVVKICYYQHATLRPYKAIYANPYSKNAPCFKDN